MNSSKDASATAHGVSPAMHPPPGLTGSRERKSPRDFCFPGPAAVAHRPSPGGGLGRPDSCPPQPGLHADLSPRSTSAFLVWPLPASPNCGSSPSSSPVSPQQTASPPWIYYIHPRLWTLKLSTPSAKMLSPQILKCHFIHLFKILFI